MVKNSFTPIIPQEENKGFLSFIKKIKRVIRNSSRNSSFSKKKKFYYSVIVRTCFQKDNYDSLIRFFLLCSYSDFYNYNNYKPVALASSGSGIGPDTPFDIFVPVFFIFIGLIAIFYYYENKKKDKDKGETLANHSQEPKAQFEGEELIDPDSEDDDSFRERVFQDMQNFLRDFVFEKPLANVVDVDGDGFTYHARLCETKLIVMCYLRPDLNKPFVGDLVRIHYNFVSLHYEIMYKFTGSKKEEGPPWAWYFVVGEIVDEFEYKDEMYFYANLDIGQSLENVEPQHLVLCKPFDFLKNELIQSGDIVYLEGNRRDRSYKIFYIDKDK